MNAWGKVNKVTNDDVVSDIAAFEAGRWLT
jgi:hypothetical protein